QSRFAWRASRAVAAAAAAAAGTVMKPPLRARCPAPGPRRRYPAAAAPATTGAAKSPWGPLRRAGAPRNRDDGATPGTVDDMFRALGSPWLRHTLSAGFLRYMGTSFAHGTEAQVEPN